MIYCFHDIKIDKFSPFIKRFVDCKPAINMINSVANKICTPGFFHMGVNGRLDLKMWAYSVFLHAGPLSRTLIKTS